MSWTLAERITTIEGYRDDMTQDAEDDAGRKESMQTMPHSKSSYQPLSMKELPIVRHLPTNKVVAVKDVTNLNYTAKPYGGTLSSKTPQKQMAAGKAVTSMNVSAKPHGIPLSATMKQSNVPPGRNPNNQEFTENCMRGTACSSSMQNKNIAGEEDLTTPQFTTNPHAHGISASSIIQDKPIDAGMDMTFTNLNGNPNTFGNAFSSTMQAINKPAGKDVTNLQLSEFANPYVTPHSSHMQEKTLSAGKNVTKTPYFAHQNMYGTPLSSSIHQTKVLAGKEAYNTQVIDNAILHGQSASFKSQQTKVGSGKEMNNPSITPSPKPFGTQMYSSIHPTKIHGGEYVTNPQFPVKPTSATTQPTRKTGVKKLTKVQMGAKPNPSAKGCTIQPTLTVGGLNVTSPPLKGNKHNYGTPTSVTIHQTQNVGVEVPKKDRIETVPSSLLIEKKSSNEPSYTEINQAPTFHMRKDEEKSVPFSAPIYQLSQVGSTYKKVPDSVELTQTYKPTQMDPNSFATSSTSSHSDISDIRKGTQKLQIEKDSDTDMFSGDEQQHPSTLDIQQYAMTRRSNLEDAGTMMRGKIDDHVTDRNVMVSQSEGKPHTSRTDGSAEDEKHSGGASNDNAKSTKLESKDDDVGEMSSFMKHVSQLQLMGWVIKPPPLMKAQQTRTLIEFPQHKDESKGFEILPKGNNTESNNKESFAVAPTSPTFSQTVSEEGEDGMENDIQTPSIPAGGEDENNAGINEKAQHEKEYQHDYSSVEESVEGKEEIPSVSNEVTIETDGTEEYTVPEAYEEKQQEEASSSNVDTTGDKIDTCSQSSVSHSTDGTVNERENVHVALHKGKYFRITRASIQQYGPN